jgi:hypothetical protein
VRILSVLLKAVCLLEKVLVSQIQNKEKKIIISNISRSDPRLPRGDHVLFPIVERIDGPSRRGSHTTLMLGVVSRGRRRALLVNDGGVADQVAFEQKMCRRLIKSTKAKF